MKISGHPLFPPPAMLEVRGEMAANGGTAEQALGRLLRMREDVIAGEKRDPLRCGYEPGMWKVGDALLDWEWCAASFEEETKRRLNLDWDGFKQAMRKFLGFETPVKMLLVMGCQRGSKSHYAAKRGCEMLTHKPSSSVAAMHMSNPRSVKHQQPLIWHYLPPEWKHQRQTETTYIKYKMKTGFSEGSLITPLLSTCDFMNYSQDKDTALQGREDDLLLPDELVPPDWIEDMMFRLATRAGRAIPMFTPVRGYTPTVQIFLEGATVALALPAYLCPTDGGPRDEAAALGLDQEELEELWAAVREKRVPMAPQGRAEDVIGWLESARREGVSSVKCQGGELQGKGRRFEMLPRVLRCADPRKAVVFFWGSDNPYGNPKEVIADVRRKNVAGLGGVRERFYGWADQIQSGKFPKFSRRVHVLAARDIPGAGENYLLMDPAKGRNAFMTWIRRTAAGIYVYREWPGKYWIPEIGVPGPWAIPSGRNQGQNDGAKGEGQKEFGFGLRRYKFEIARVEGWEAWLKWKTDLGAKWDEDSVPKLAEVDDWSDDPGPLRQAQGDPAGTGSEVIEGRYMDSRAASEPKRENDRPVTLLTDFDLIGLEFDLTPGNDIGDGIERINSALDYTVAPGAPQSDGKTVGQSDEDNCGFWNRPTLFVSEECENTIYALENWKHADGEHGACKDPVDNVRYFLDLGIEFGNTRPRTRGGFSYGTRGRNRWKRTRGMRLPPATVEGKACQI